MCIWWAGTIASSRLLISFLVGIAWTYNWIAFKLWSFVFTKPSSFYSENSTETWGVKNYCTFIKIIEPCLDSQHNNEGNNISRKLEFLKISKCKWKANIKINEVLQGCSDMTVMSSNSCVSKDLERVIFNIIWLDGLLFTAQFTALAYSWFTQGFKILFLDIQDILTKKLK